MHIIATIISPYLQYFIDFFFKNGIFPESCTLAEVIPLYKKGNKLDLNNCRPISILTCFSKIIERLIYNRLQQLLKKHSVVHKQWCKKTRKLYSSKSFVTDKKTTWSKVQSTDQKKYLSKSKKVVILKLLK